MSASVPPLGAEVQSLAASAPGAGREHNKAPLHWRIGLAKYEASRGSERGAAW